MWLQIHRSLKLALKNFWRNFGLSLITITILVMSLIAVNLVLIVNILTQTAISLVEERIDVSLLFKADADPKAIEEIKDTLSKTPVVKSLTLFTRDQVLDNFKAKHKDSKEILSALAELDQNPFGASIIVKAETSRDYEKILKVLDLPDYQKAIEKTTFDDHSAIIKNIGLITGRVKNIALAASIVLLFVSFFIIFNTIRVGIYTHREEIGIMKLVGATNWFVRSPFFIEVLLNCLLAVLVATGFLYLGLWFSEPYLNQFFASNGFSLINHFNRNWLIYFGGQFLALVLLSFLSAALAMRKFLRV